MQIALLNNPEIVDGFHTKNPIFEGLFEKVWGEIPDPLRKFDRFSIQTAGPQIDFRTFPRVTVFSQASCPYMHPRFSPGFSIFHRFSLTPILESTVRARGGLRARQNA